MHIFTCLKLFADISLLLSFLFFGSAFNFNVVFGKETTLFPFTLLGLFAAFLVFNPPPTNLATPSPFLRNFFFGAEVAFSVGLLALLLFLSASSCLSINSSNESTSFP